MLSWDGRYSDARDQLDQVLAKNPANIDALSALIRVELWSGHPDKAEQLAYKALQHHPRNYGSVADAGARA
jgi:predicted Zn-dependent protease